MKAPDAPRTHGVHVVSLTRSPRGAGDVLEEVPDFPRGWRLFVLAWQLLGAFPLRRKARWRVSRALQAAAVLCVGNAFYANYRTVHVLDFKLGANAVVKNTLYRIALLLATVCGIPCLLHGVFSAARLEHFINTLLITVRELRPADQPTWPRDWVLRTTLSGAFLSLFIFGKESAHMYSIKSPLRPVQLVLPLNQITPCMVELQYYLLSCALGLAFLRLAENIKALVRPAVSPSVRWLESARRCHAKLVALSAALHTLLGPQLFVVVLACRLQLLATVYVLASDILTRKKAFADMYLSMLDVFTYLLRYVAVCFAGTFVRATWSLLLQQLGTLEPTTSHGGMRLGIGLITSLFATTTTYLLVLLSFEE